MLAYVGPMLACAGPMLSHLGRYVDRPGVYLVYAKVGRAVLHVSCRLSLSLSVCLSLAYVGLGGAYMEQSEAIWCASSP